MNDAQRAKIFAPYAALRGFGAFLSAVERETVPRVILGEDAQEALDRQLRQLRPGQQIRVTYYQNEQYVEAGGALKRIDSDTRCLLLDGRKIPLADILNIQENEVET